MSPPQSLSAELCFSERPSEADTNTNCPATLVWLKTNLAAVYLAGGMAASEDKPPKLAREAYLNL